MGKARCEYGHVRSEKKKLMLGAVSMLVIGIGVFILGLALNKWDKKNIFTVIAILFVLPMARYLTTLMVLLPYRTPNKESFENVKRNLKEGCVLYSDYVFTLSEKIWCLSFLVISGDSILGLVPKGYDKTRKLQETLEEGMKKRQFFRKVVITDSEEKYIKMVSREKTAEEKEDMTEILDFLKSLAV